MDLGARKKAGHHPHAISQYSGVFIPRARKEAEGGMEDQGGGQRLVVWEHKGWEHKLWLRP